MEHLLRNVRAVGNFVQHGGEEIRQLGAAVAVWLQAHTLQGETIHVDTQTTDAGEEPQAAGDAARWVPPMNAEQWQGSIPTPDRGPDSQSEEPLFPTDEELVGALEEYERQAQEEALQEARAELSGGEPESDRDHRRRRDLAGAFNESGNPQT